MLIIPHCFYFLQFETTPKVDVALDTFYSKEPLKNMWKILLVTTYVIEKKVTRNVDLFTFPDVPVTSGFEN